MTNTLSIPERINLLRKNRPRSRFLHGSLFILLSICVFSWFSGHIQVAELFSSKRADNLHRFLQHEATPSPIRNLSEGESAIGAFADWIVNLWTQYGMQALIATFWISTMAMVLAGAYAMLSSPFGARTLMQRDPFWGRGRGWIWQLTSSSIRLIAVFLRAIPEYIWAFLLVSVLGPSAWPAVLALAIHNAGIMSRLGSDTIENLNSQSLRALRLLGSTRIQISLGGVFSMVLPRFLLFFFYRFETCVREATVLGMLGIYSLGYWIDEARARGRYDEMLFLVALGALLVLAADFVSWWARRAVRLSGLGPAQGVRLRTPESDENVPID